MLVGECRSLGVWFIFRFGLISLAAVPVSSHTSHGTPRFYLLMKWFGSHVGAASPGIGDPGVAHDAQRQGAPRN